MIVTVGERAQGTGELTYQTWENRPVGETTTTTTPLFKCLRVFIAASWGRKLSWCVTKTKIEEHPSHLK